MLINALNKALQGLQILALPFIAIIIAINDTETVDVH